MMEVAKLQGGRIISLFTGSPFCLKFIEITICKSAVDLKKPQKRKIAQKIAKKLNICGKSTEVWGAGLTS